MCSSSRSWARCCVACYTACVGGLLCPTSLSPALVCVFSRALVCVVSRAPYGCSSCVARQLCLLRDEQTLFRSIPDRLPDLVVILPWFSPLLDCTRRRRFMKDSSTDWENMGVALRACLRRTEIEHGRLVQGVVNLRELSQRGKLCLVEEN